MSWIEKIKTDLTITCGDGKQYRPNWIGANKSVEYNVATFNFKGLEGTLVRRGRPQGAKYQLQLYFQGEDHLDQQSSFLESSADSRPWTLYHPFYGSLLVQPVSQGVDNSNLNVSIITSQVIETIPIDEAAVTNVSPIDRIQEVKAGVDVSFDQTFASQIPNINAVDSSSLSNNMSNIFNSVSKSIKESKWKDEYFNARNKANSILNNPIYDTLTTMQAIRDFTTMPYRFSDDLRTRLQMFASQFQILSSTVSTLFTRSSKKVYENNAGITISGMFLSAVTNIGNAFENAVGTLSVIDTLLSAYNQYIADLDSLQSDNGGSPDSYIPDDDALSSLYNLVTMVISTLFGFASNGKQQRIAYLSQDSNVILVAHAIYGYIGDDSVIDKVISDNDLSMDELLFIRKGRKIVYYI